MTSLPRITEESASSRKVSSLSNTSGPRGSASSLKRGTTGPNRGLHTTLQTLRCAIASFSSFSSVWTNPFIINKTLLLSILKENQGTAEVCFSDKHIVHGKAAVCGTCKRPLRDVRCLLSGGKGEGRERLCFTYARALHRVL